MDILAKCRHTLVRGLEILIIVVVIALTLDVLWGILTRVLANEHLISIISSLFGEGAFYQFFKTGQAPYTDEAARVLLVWLSMFGGALAFGEKAHLGVDFFVGLMHAQSRKTVALIVQGIVLFMAIVIFIIGGTALALSQMSQQLSTIPFLTRGTVYASMPIAGVFICLFTVEAIIDIIRTPAEALGAQTQSEG